MEHRCSVRKTIDLQVIFYKHGLPVQSGTCLNMGLGGMMIDTGERRWRKNEYLEVEILGHGGRPAMRVPAVVVHQNAQGVGIMFDAVSAEQRRVMRTWLFGRPEPHKAPAREVA